MKSFVGRVREGWWAALFTSGCCAISIHAMSDRNRAISELEFRTLEMEKEKSLALQQKEDLRLHIASQNDPAWIEMILMRELGVVPEGWLKVHFKK